MKAAAGVVIGTLALVMSGTVAAEGKSGTEKMDKGAAVSSPDLSDSYKWSDLAGFEVQNSKGEELGSISELILDKQGKVSHVVLEEGGVLGGGSYVVPWDRLTLTPGDQVAVIDVNPDNLASEFAAFDEGMPTAGTRKEGEKMKDDSMRRDGAMRESGKPSATN